MIKKIISILMVFCLGASMTLPIFSGAEIATESPAEESASDEALRYKIPVSEEYLARFFYAPEEVLSSSTPDLLDYFLGSLFMSNQTLPLSSSLDSEKKSDEMDYMKNAAFRELMKREDLIDVVGLYVRNVYYKEITDEYEIEKLHAFVSHIPDEMLTFTDNYKYSGAASKATAEETSDGKGYRVAVSSEYLDRYFAAPQNVLEGSTEELLDYFVNSLFFKSQTFSSASSFETVKTEDEKHSEYLINVAFSELLVRDDLGDVLAAYVDSVYSELETKEPDMVLVTSPEDKGAAMNSFTADQLPYVVDIPRDVYHLNMLIYHIPKEVIISAFASTEIANDSVASADESAVRSSSEEYGEYVGYLNGIYYYSAEPIITFSGNEVEATFAGSELTMAQMRGFVAEAHDLGVPILQSPTAYYNCHSYAWYERSSDNDRWINDISGFLYDAECIELNVNEIEEGDIVVYYDKFGILQHSGVVEEAAQHVEDVVVTSKWGQGVLCTHAIDNVPTGYLYESYSPSGESLFYVVVEFYRYPVGASASSSSEPYEELGNSAELVCALPISMSSVMGPDDESAD